MNDAGRRFDAQLAELAPACHAVFSLAELNGLGLTARAVQRRAAAARLHRVHHGVYALVPPAMLTARGRWRAATLATGAGLRPGALSHRCAAGLRGLREAAGGDVEVIVAGRSTHRHHGIRTHRSVTLDPVRDIEVVDAIAVTTVARTLLDCAAVLPRRGLERTLDQAEVLRVFDLLALRDQLARNPGHPGAGRLRAVLQANGAGETVTDSELEEAVLALLRLRHLPPPQPGGPIDPGDGGPILRPDFVYRRARVALEVDGRATHLTRRAFEEDRRRDQRLTLAGWRVVRVTWRQLTEEPERIARLLAGLLAAELDRAQPSGSKQP